MLGRSTTKDKEKVDNHNQYEEFIIPNWTYSTESGFIYNPIREQRLKTTKNPNRQKTKRADIRTDPMDMFSYNKVSVMIMSLFSFLVFYT